MTRAAGITLVETLVGLTLGLGALAGTTALLSASLAARARAGTGADAVAAAAGAVDQIVRDVRLAGYDPRERGLQGITAATPLSLVLEADLDGDGTIDGGSEEHVAYRLSAAGDSLLRVVGRQAMPLLSELGSFRLRYLDAEGGELDPSNPATADAARVVTVALTTRSVGPLPGARMSGGARILNR